MVNRSTQSYVLSIYDKMLSQYGSQHWWIDDNPLTVIVGAILTQATRWPNVEKAITNLIAEDAMSLPVLRALPEKTLSQIIYPSGYFNSKARKLKAMADYIGNHFNDDLDSMRKENTDILRTMLLSIHGVGNETADTILLYAFDKTTFIADNYTKRIFYRLGIINKNASYLAIKSLFLNQLIPDSDWLKEYHALIINHGQKVCGRNPKCKNCCLVDVCLTGKKLIKTMGTNNTSN